jgi:D-alanine-D-alanine ligase-like ATP-grasp enzyme
MLTLSLIGRPLFLAASKLGKSLSRENKKVSSKKSNLYDLLAAWRLGEYLDKPDDKTMLLDHVLWQEATRRGIRMREFRPLGLPTNTFVAYLPGDTYISFDSFPTPTNAPQSAWWIDDKATMKKHFKKLGIPVAEGGSVLSWRGAQKLFKEIGGPVITKPFEGTASRHTTLHIQTEADLKRGFKVAKQVSPVVIIERELRGAVYRPTLVGGKLVATIRRDKPQVVGDGTRTIAELIEEENKHPKRQGPYFSQIKLTPAGERELAYQNLSEASVPEEGRVVTLHPKINWSVGGTTTDVTDLVHQDNKELFERIAKILNAPLVGIDFIIEDIGRSWKEQQNCGVIECNSRPYFDNHHLPFYGEPHNVAGKIWDLVA